MLPASIVLCYPVLEKKDFIPSIPQLESLGECLGFDPDEAFTEQSASRLPSPSPLNIAVAGTGYVGLSNCNITCTAQSCYCC